MNAVVAGALLSDWMAAAAAAEAAVLRLLPRDASLARACAAADNADGAGMSRYLPPFVTLSVAWSANWISACFLQHAHTVNPLDP